MKKLLTSTAFVFGMIGYAGSASAEECGRVTIANMNWQSAEVLAHIDNIILGDGYGCEVELVPGDNVPTLTSMIEKGEPDVAPEAWINAVREPLEKAVGEGRLVYAAPALSDGGVESWWIPKYIADANPDIKKYSDVLKHPELFPAPEDPSKGGIYNCPAGWACQTITNNLVKAYGADEAGWVVVDTGSAAGLDGSIAKAFENNEGWLGYYWAPTAILGKYEMVPLAGDVEHDAAEWNSCTTVIDCAAPKMNSWPKTEVYTVVTSSFAERAGPAMEYLNNRAWPNSVVNKLLSWMTDNQATGEEGADYFLKNNEDVWTQWVSPEVAEKVKKSIM